MEFVNISESGIISYAVGIYGDPVKTKFFSCWAQSNYPGKSCTSLFSKRGGWVSNHETKPNYLQFNVLKGSLTLQSIKISSVGSKKGLTSWSLQGSDDFINYQEIGNNQDRDFCSVRTQTFKMTQIKPMKSYRFLINGQRCYDSEYSAEIDGIELYGKVTAWKSKKSEWKSPYFGTLIIHFFYGKYVKRQSFLTKPVF